MTTVYVKNVSDLQLNRLVLAANGKGLLPLLPTQCGVLAPDVATSKAVQAWIEKNRLQIITKQQYEEYVTSLDAPAPVVAAPVQVAPRKTGVQKLNDGTSAVVQGIDEIPEADELPEPIVSNVSKDGTSIAISAPKDSEPLTEEAGDPIVVSKGQLRPRVLEATGHLREDGLDTPAKEEVQVPVVTSVAKAPTVPLVDEKTAAVVGASAESILNLGHWRQQTKAIEVCDDKVALTTIAEQSKTAAVVKAAKTRLEALIK